MDGKIKANGDPTPGREGVEFWAKRWELAQSRPGALPAFEDVALGSIGAHADSLALVQTDGDSFVILQSSQKFEAWLNAADGRPRADGSAKLHELCASALDTGTPIDRCCSDIHGDRIETRPLLAMPLASRWFTRLVLFYVGPLLASHDVTQTVYRATREGFLMLMPVRAKDGRITDFRVATANPGAAVLLGQDIEHLASCTCRSLFAERADALVQTFVGVLQTAGSCEIELDLVFESREAHLQGSVSALDSLVVLTLTDVTELRAREAGFRLMFEANPVPMALVDTAKMQFIDANAATLEHYGHQRESLIGAPLTTILHPDEHEALRASATGTSPSYEGTRVWRHIRRDGREIAVRPYARRLTIRKRPAALVALFDVTDTRLIEERLRATKLFVDTIIENIPSALLVQDVQDGQLLLINRASETLLGLERSLVLGRRIPAHLPVGTAGEAAQERPFQAAGAVPRVLSVKTLDVRDPDGASRYHLTIADDVTERRAIENRIAHMALHDALTDLPNRMLFAEHLQAALARAAPGGDTTAVLCIDLDAFKAVNDTLGHAAGDELLRAVAIRLSQALRAGDSVARLGGDEFAVLMVAPPSAERVSDFAARLIADLSSPFSLLGHDIRIGASIGIALATVDGADGETLLRDADLALYRAKHEGRSTFRFFEPEMNLRIQARHDLERDLRHALAAGEFELHYQPLVALHSRQITGCEALLRWHHPTRGMISPADFIPLAEETGLIGPIGTWVLRQACSDARAWPAHVTVAVNVSAVQFRDAQLVATVVSALASAGLAPERLEIEITESVLLAHTDAHLATLHRLRDLGIKIAMDDFGTGYSSLSYLSNFPFDKIKIDQSFLRGVDTNAKRESIVKAVIELGLRLGIATVAEGVETDAQWTHLRDWGCGLGQGYLFSRPLPAAALRQWISDAEGQARAA